MDRLYLTISTWWVPCSVVEDVNQKQILGRLDCESRQLGLKTEPSYVAPAMSRDYPEFESTAIEVA
jgi:hypothetical protein